MLNISKYNDGLYDLFKSNTSVKYKTDWYKLIP